MRAALTSYLNRLPHFQYNRQLRADDSELLGAWAKSVEKCGMFGVVIHDCLSQPFMDEWASSAVAFERIEWQSPWNATEERFVAYRNWLLSRRQVNWVMMTDMGDVEFYRNPFTFMADKKKVYVGSQTETIGCSPCRTVERWMLSGYDMLTDPGKPILNPGILGGHRNTVLEFLNKLIAEMKRGKPGSIGLDLVAFNRLIYRERIPYVTGFPLHTVFYQNQQPCCGAFIRHK